MFNRRDFGKFCGAISVAALLPFKASAKPEYQILWRRVQLPPERLSLWSACKGERVYIAKRSGSNMEV